MGGEVYSLLLGLIVGVLVILTPPARSHPQCLDFKPPFTPSSPLNFCRQYSNFSCCRAIDDSRRYADYRHLLINHQARQEAWRCQGILYHMQCLTCSPYAAHIYDAESNGQPAIFPSLCPSFCRLFLRRCRTFVPTFTPDRDLIAMAQYPNRDEEFCSRIEGSDSAYCYPDVLYKQRFQSELVQAFSNEEGCICMEPFADNLRNPLIFKHFPDGTGRILVGEQIGTMYVYQNGENGTQQGSGPFLDLTDVVLVSTDPNRRYTDERGFLGFAFHPNYTQNGKFYCYFYVSRAGKAYTQLREFKVSSTDRNRADANSSRLLLEIFQPYGNHNGGETTFGTDGYLYLFTGDGGAAGDPGNRGQNKSTLLGKALRINVNLPDGSLEPYAIPQGNPFVTGEGRPEIFAYGLRNPWRCDVDEGDPDTGAGRGRIFCGDVGQSAFEEIDIVEKGKNYGWRVKEGYACYNPPQNCGTVEDEVLPIFAYNRSVGRSVTGGHVYRGCSNPALNGAYIFGDYDTGVLFKLEETPSGPWKETELKTCGSDVCFNGLVSRYERNILSFGEDEDGEVYILTTAGPSVDQRRGKIYRIIDPRRRGDPTRCRRNRRQRQR